MKIKEIKKVTVKYNKKTVGYLAQITPSVIGFQYDEEWQKNGFPFRRYLCRYPIQFIRPEKKCSAGYTAYFSILCPMAGANCF